MVFLVLSVCRLALNSAPMGAHLLGHMVSCWTDQRGAVLMELVVP